MEKRILDPCCGSKMFWFNKNNPDVEFCDIRTVPKHEYYPGRSIEINPDTVCDFTHLPFADNSFYLVVFDPPHLPDAGDTSIMALKYGCLKGDWKTTLSKGFSECMRVLKPNGTLVFKWSEIRIPLSEVLPLFSQEPLFGNRCRKRGNTTHWLCFMKDGGDEQIQ
jgi:SAM-dependent methyltransferase